MRRRYGHVATPLPCHPSSAVSKSRRSEHDESPVRVCDLEGTPIVGKKEAMRDDGQRLASAMARLYPPTPEHESIDRMFVGRWVWVVADNVLDEELELDRGESRMTADARRDAGIETDVRLMGLIPRLTSPSRNDSRLVDLWFEVGRSQRTREWDDAFARVAEGWRPDPRHPSHFALFSHPCSSPLIVARQVSADRAVWGEIETEARALVSRVNRAVAEQRSTPAAVGAGAGWPITGSGTRASAAPRSWLAEAAQAIRGLVPKPTIPVSQSSSTGAR